MKIFLVIPLHNEEAHIARVLKDVLKYKLPVIVVNDGSTDNSTANINKIKNREITLLEHKINLGKGAAMKTGAEYAFSKGADSVIFMDADGQHDPENISSFTKILESRKFEVIFGSRNLNFGVPLVRYLGNKIASLVISMLFGIYVSDPICGFRAITLKAYEKIKWESSGYGVESEMLARVGKYNLKFTEIPVNTIYHDRDKGVTILDAFGILVDVIKLRLTI